MKTLRDRDLSIDCDYEAMGQTTGDVVDEMTEHIKAEHPDEFDRVKGMMKMNIKENRSVNNF